MRLKWSIAVGGTHGKTTTTSMIAALLDAAGLDPTVINGGIINAWGSNARLGKGDWMVVEADASDGSNLSLGLAHDVFALPPNPANATRCHTRPSLTKVGPPCHGHSSNCDSDAPSPKTCHWHQLFQSRAFSLPLRCLMWDNEGIEMPSQEMFTATFMYVMHLLQLTGKDDAY